MCLICPNLTILNLFIVIAFVVVVAAAALPLLCTFVRHFCLAPVSLPSIVLYPSPFTVPPPLSGRFLLPWLFTVFAFSTLHKFPLKNCRYKHTDTKRTQRERHVASKHTHTHTQNIHIGKQKLRWQVPTTTTATTRTARTKNNGYRKG